MSRKGGAPENMRPPFQSGNEAQENGKKGGIRSGEVRREKKILREAFEKKFGKSADKMAECAFAIAVNKDKPLEALRAIELIRDTCGEKPNERVEFTNPPTIIDDVRS